MLLLYSRFNIKLQSEVCIQINPGLNPTGLVAVRHHHAIQGCRSQYVTDQIMNKSILFSTGEDVFMNTIPPVSNIKMCRQLATFRLQLLCFRC